MGVRISECLPCQPGPFRGPRTDSVSASQIDPGRYAERVANEVRSYREVENVHDLPEIYHYWNRGHVDPLLRRLGWPSFHEFFIQPLSALCRTKEAVSIVSLGSGNGDLELTLARLLRQAGHGNFSFRRLELNDAMRERARRDAAVAGLETHLIDEAVDLNRWEPGEPFDAVVANHSLHHVCELEHLFDVLRAGLPDDGVFVVNDMIGRNGHMRWPEALELVQAIWGVMPDRYRYNRQLNRYESRYENWDCSTEGFEGIRAQDILPLLNDRFHAEAFLAYGNVIDLFVDRGFGHNFDATNDEDRAFIDAVACLDETALTLGVVKPTHVLAHYRTHPVGCRYVEPFSPQFSMRPVDPDPPPASMGSVTTAGRTGSDTAESPNPSPPAPTRFASPPVPASSGSPSAAYRLGMRAAGLLPPIRRIREQRDALAAQVDNLRAQLERARSQDR
jgi:SAM-dependent methyltransferase